MANLPWLIGSWSFLALISAVQAAACDSSCNRATCSQRAMLQVRLIMKGSSLSALLSSGGEQKFKDVAAGHLVFGERLPMHPKTLSRLARNVNR